jgi:hypothetical protein
MAREVISFAFLAGPGLLTQQASVLAASIREFGGEYSQAPMWGLLEEEAADLRAGERSGFEALGIQVLPYRLPQDMQAFPFARKVAAARAAELHARSNTEHLLWMDAHSLVVKPLREATLEDPLCLGCRPVDHLMIGSRFDEPIDPFWEYIYEICEVPSRRFFPMLTSVDHVKIRPYVNAGFLLVKPHDGILQDWFEVFAASYNLTRSRSFYDQNDLTRIFVHQAVLSGVVLQRLERSQIKILSNDVNVPLHLYGDMDEDSRVKLLDQMVTFRYDVRFDEPDWLEHLPLKEPLKSWLQRQWEEG